MGSTVDAEIEPGLGDARGAHEGHGAPERGRAAISSRPGRRFAVALVAVGVGLAVFAFAPFVIVATAAARHHGVFLGVDSPDPLDGLQYLAWVRDAHKGLIRNLFGSAHDAAIFLHPMWSPSGWLQAATGVSDAAIMVFWTAVGALVLFAGCVRLVTRHLPPQRPAARVIALCLALFSGLTPLVLLLPHVDPLASVDLGLAGEDMISAASLWGYVPMAIAVGLMPFAIDGVSRLLDGRGDRRTVVRTAAIGLFVAWLHPWQGETLIVLAVGLAAWSRLDVRTARAAARVASRSRGEANFRLAAPLLVVAATGAPLLYYLILSRVDAGWAVAEATDRAATIPWPLIVLCVAPLALIVLIAGRRIAGDRAARGLLLWPLSTLLVIALTRSGQDRALAGIGVPIAVLVVRAWPTDLRRARWALATGAAVAVALAPTAIYAAHTIVGLSNPYFTADAELNSSNVRAASVAARSTAGGLILAPAVLGTAIPALTDAPTWVGHPIWTPDYGPRDTRTEALFNGTMTLATARAFVRSVGAAALVEPCGYAGHLESALAALGYHEQRVGCALVYALHRG